MTGYLKILPNYFLLVLRGYGAIGFAAHPLPGLMMLAASFYYPYIGILGLAGNIISNISARWIGGYPAVMQSGIYGVSGTLVGLALGMYGEAGIRIWVFLFFGAALAGFTSVVLGNRFSRNDLPILSLPLMIVIWPILLAYGPHNFETNHFIAIPIFARADAYLFDLLPLGMFKAVKMFGSILFQDNFVSSLIVLAAIAFYSRITLAYGLWGAMLGLLTYQFIHGTLDGFHGLNYVLTAMALGGFFLVANRHIFPLVTLGVVAAGILDRSASLFLNAIGGDTIYLPTLALAFNAVTLLILYPIKTAGIRQGVDKRLIPVPLALVRSPETNLRWQEKALKAISQRTMLTLPFMGEWSVLQGNNGEWTHKAAGRYAWDFVITDSSGKQHRNFGLHTSDYYAFGLPVLAPAPGVVVAAVGDIEDNQPRTADLERNWGNYIVIDHGNGEFSELSHFKQQSILVALGQVVQRGQVLGGCGNSGRSPVPHIHFQLQQSAKLGAETIPALFAEGTVNDIIGVNRNPVKDEKVSPVEIEAEANWTLLGKEAETWRYRCEDGLFRFEEGLFFTTDVYGWPVVTSGDFTWYILDRPSFVELVPDFKTLPSLLVRSVWVKLIGESLLLPKKLSRNLAWQGGKVSGKAGSIWMIETDRLQLKIDTNTGRIVEGNLVNASNVTAKMP